MSSIPEKNCNFNLSGNAVLFDYLINQPSSDGKFSRYNAFVDLLHRRVEEDTKVWAGNREIIVNEGSALTPVLTLSNEWGWDRKTVRRFLSVLEECKVIKVDNTDGVTITSFPGISDCIVWDTPTAPGDMGVRSVEVGGVNRPAMTSKRICKLMDRVVGLDEEGELFMGAELDAYCREAYDDFYKHLPLAPRVEYNKLVRVLLLSSYVIGMQCRRDLLNQILEEVSKDPLQNGSMIGCGLSDEDCVMSFNRFFEPTWHKILMSLPKKEC